MAFPCTCNDEGTEGFWYFFLLLNFSLVNFPFPLHEALMESSVKIPYFALARGGSRKAVRTSDPSYDNQNFFLNNSRKDKSRGWFIRMMMYQETVLWFLPAYHVGCFGHCPSKAKCCSFFYKSVSHLISFNYYFHFATVIQTFSVAYDQRIPTDKEITVSLLEFEIVSIVSPFGQMKSYSLYFLYIVLCSVLCTQNQKNLTSRRTVNMWR